jgi:hypothetical protein
MPFWQQVFLTSFCVFLNTHSFLLFFLTFVLSDGLAFPAALRLRRKRDQVILFVKVSQQIPELAIVNELLHEFVLQVVSCGWTPSQVKQCFVYISSF